MNVVRRHPASQGLWNDKDPVSVPHKVAEWYLSLMDSPTVSNNFYKSSSKPEMQPKMNVNLAKFLRLNHKSMFCYGENVS